ncbi:MAG TPA: DUF4124 domain-containing protein [Steroidobacteraceae bacterium]|jgi:chromosome segregation ATPase
MRKATILLASMLSSLMLASVADAQQKPRPSSGNKSSPSTTYKWVDEQGVTHYGDSVPAEYSQREQTLLNEQGVVMDKRLAEMSPKEAAAHAARQKEESRKKQHDMFLISTYPSVKEIENVRDARLAQINGQITAAEAYIASLTTRIDGLKNRSQTFAPYNTKPGARRMPDDLAEEMVRAMSELRTQNSALTAKRSELKTMQDSYEADIARFKELRTSAAARLNENGPRKQ